MISTSFTRYSWILNIVSLRRISKIILPLIYTASDNVSIARLLLLLLGSMSVQFNCVICIWLLFKTIWVGCCCFYLDIYCHSERDIRVGYCGSQLMLPLDDTGATQIPIHEHSICSISTKILFHDDAIKWKHFPRCWPFVRGNHRSPINSPHKGQWRGALIVFFALMVSLTWALNKRLSKHSFGCWFDTPSRPLWRHYNVAYAATSLTNSCYKCLTIGTFINKDDVPVINFPRSLKCKIAQNASYIYEYIVKNTLLHYTIQ